MGFRSPQLRTRGPLKKPDVSRCAARGRRQTARCCGSPFWPHLRRLREPWTRGRSGGIRSRGAGCSAPRSLRAPCVSHRTDSAERASAPPRTPRPLSRERGDIFPPPHPTLQDQSYLRPALRESCSSPRVTRRLFLSTTCKRRLWVGGWGILGNRGQIHSLCAPLAPRSGPLLAGSSR